MITFLRVLQREVLVWTDHDIQKKVPRKTLVGTELRNLGLFRNYQKSLVGKNFGNFGIIRGMKGAQQSIPMSVIKRKVFQRVPVVHVMMLNSVKCFRVCRTTPNW